MSKALSFGDRVRVCNSDASHQAGLAGALGQVQGFTTPSVTGVDVGGGALRDYAVAVYFSDQEATVWITPELLEFVDHSPGTEIRLGTKSWRRLDDGEWVRIDQ